MAHIYNSQLDAYSLYHETQSRGASSSSSSSIGPALPALGHALAGSTGTAISNLTLYPLDLIITRLQVQRSLRSSSSAASTTKNSEYAGVLDAFKKIYQNEGGIAAFYSGALHDTGKSIADSFLFFLFYNYLRTNRLQKDGKKATTLPALEELIVGALAGGCSKFFTTPISNVMTRKQTSSRDNTVQEIVEKIKEEKGLQGFWSGYSASLVLTLNPSLTFFLYEFFKRSFLPRARRDDPGARTTFLMAAVAKAIASTITYPFSLAKARSQASGSPPVDRETSEEIESDLSSMNTSASVSEKEAKAKAAASKTKSVAKRSNVFMTILNIYKTEGLEALYEGVYGEILKGFFSHGITMLVKEAIHKLIIQAYFAILKALNKFPSPTELANQAGERAKEGINTVQSGAEQTRVTVEHTAEQAGTALKESYEKLSEAVESGKNQLGVIGERAAVIGSNASELTSNGAKTAAEGFKGSAKIFGDRMNAAAESAKNATTPTGGSPSARGSLKSLPDETVQKAGKVVGAEELKSEEAGHLLGNAQQMLGNRIKEAGEGVKGFGKGENEK